MYRGLQIELLCPALGHQVLGEIVCVGNCGPIIDAIYGPALTATSVFGAWGVNLAEEKEV